MSLRADTAKEQDINYDYVSIDHLAVVNTAHSSAVCMHHDHALICPKSRVGPTDYICAYIALLMPIKYFLSCGARQEVKLPKIGLAGPLGNTCSACWSAFRFGNAAQTHCSVTFVIASLHSWR